MKTAIIFLVLLLGTEISFGQLSPMRSYGNHTTQDIKKLVWEDSSKGLAFKASLLEKFQECLKDTLTVTEKNLDYLLQDKYMFCEEVTLRAGAYTNSGWNGQKIVFFNGKKLTDFVWIFRMGSHEVILCKSNCLNILNVFEQNKLLRLLCMHQLLYNKYNSLQYNKLFNNKHHNKHIMLEVGLLLYQIIVVTVVELDIIQTLDKLSIKCL